MLDWVHAPDVPRSWEGEWVVEWRESEPTQPRLVFLADYSRKPHHCGGFWFARINLPIDRRLIAKRAALAKAAPLPAVHSLSGEK
jgi:hypothetical protein